MSAAEDFDWDKDVTSLSPSAGEMTSLSGSSEKSRLLEKTVWLTLE
jgi:hypothetical protein